MEGVLLEQVSLESKEGVKKLVSVSITSTLVTGTREEGFETVEAVETAGAGKDDKESKGSKNPRSNLTQVPYIRYPITFRKKSVLVSALFDSSSEFNAIHLTFAKELGPSIRPTDVRAQKIDGTTLDIFGIVVAAFSVIDKANQVRFFEEIFLVANISLEIVLRIPFLTLSGIDINFLSWKLW